MEHSVFPDDFDQTDANDEVTYCQNNVRPEIKSLYDQMTAMEADIAVNQKRVEAANDLSKQSYDMETAVGFESTINGQFASKYIENLPLKRILAMAFSVISVGTPINDHTIMAATSLTQEQVYQLKYGELRLSQILIKDVEALAMICVRYHLPLEQKYLELAENELLAMNKN